MAATKTAVGARPQAVGRHGAGRPGDVSGGTGFERRGSDDLWLPRRSSLRARISIDALLAGCRLSAGGVSLLALMLHVGGIEKFVLLCRAFGAAIAFMVLVVVMGVARAYAPGGPAPLASGERRRGPVRRVALWSAVLTALTGLIAALLYSLQGGPDRLGWAIVGAFPLAAAIAARAWDARSLRRGSGAPHSPTKEDPVSLDHLRKPMIAILIVAFAAAIALAADKIAVQAGLTGALPGMLLLASAMALVVSLTLTSVLSELPLSLLPRSRALRWRLLARLGGAQPLPALLPSLVASVVLLVPGVLGGSRHRRA